MQFIWKTLRSANFLQGRFRLKSEKIAAKLSNLPRQVLKARNVLSNVSRSFSMAMFFVDLGGICRCFWIISRACIVEYWELFPKWQQKIFSHLRNDEKRMFRKLNRYHGVRLAFCMVHSPVVASQVFFSCGHAYNKSLCDGSLFTFLCFDWSLRGFYGFFFFFFFFLAFTQ